MLRDHLNAKLIDAELGENIGRLLPGQRWTDSEDFADGKIKIIECLGVKFESEYLAFCIVQSGVKESRYSLLIRLVVHELKDEALPFLGTVKFGDETWYAYEGGKDPVVGRLLCKMINYQEALTGAKGALRSVPLGAFHLPKKIQAQPMNVEQSNTAWNVNGKLFLKWYRRLPEKHNNEFEVLKHLAKSKFKGAPRLKGFWEYGDKDSASTMGIIQDWVPDAVDGWFAMIQAVESGTFNRAKQKTLALARVLADFHCCLGEVDDLAFLPEPMTKKDMRQTIRAMEHDATALENIDSMEESATANLAELLKLVGNESFYGEDLGQKQRVHGDLHLGQTLFGNEDCYLVDFEGEPKRDSARRAQKESPLRDVAGMIRSFSYLRWSVKNKTRLDQWEADTRHTFVLEYLKQMKDSISLPTQGESVIKLIRVYELEKLIYEFHYEANFRPDWIAVPLNGLRSLKQKLLKA